MKPMHGKSLPMRSAIEALFPGTKAAIAEDRCPVCKNDIDGFRDHLSQKEYRISGLCQLCQDEVFGK